MPRQWSKVDFPAPEGPTIETESGDDIEAELDPFDDPTNEDQVREMLEDMGGEDNCGSFPGEQC